jgi:glutamate dehydrogenase (NAD(P)+)
MDVNEVCAYLGEKGGIKGYGNAEYVKDGNSLLERPCDILIPAALENQITESNAARIQARVVAEAANGPTTFHASSILAQRKIAVIPDLYLNAGGVTVSYFEWSKNLAHIRFGRLDKRIEESQTAKLMRAIEELSGNQFSEAQWADLARGAGELERVRAGLDDTMRDGYQEIRQAMDSYATGDLRTAAFVVAIDKVATSYLQLGVFP